MITLSTLPLYALKGDAMITASIRYNQHDNVNVSTYCTDDDDETARILAALLTPGHKAHVSSVLASSPVVRIRDSKRQGWDGRPAVVALIIPRHQPRPITF